MLFQTQSNVLFRLFRLLTAQVGSNLVIICTNSLDCYKYGQHVETDKHVEPVYKAPWNN